jgi:hypothetical protein
MENVLPVMEIIMLIIWADVSELKIHVNIGKSVESVQNAHMDGLSTPEENVLLMFILEVSEILMINLFICFALIFKIVKI